MVMKVGSVLSLGAALMISASPAFSQNVALPPVNDLHQALHLSAQQEPAWKAYRAEAAAPTVAQDRRRAASTMFPTLDAPQRMDLIEAEMKQELLDLQRQSEALKAFYVTLTPEQKTIFDAKTLPPANSQQQQPG
jgi:hypothetical protein